MDRSIAPIVVQRIKWQLLPQNPLNEMIAPQSHNPKITGRAQSIAVIFAISVLLMRHVLITTWINSPILDARLQVFLCQIPFQIDRAKPVGELEAVFTEVVDDGVKDVLSDRLQR